MFKQAKFRMGYIDEVHAQVLELPYAGEELSMVLLLPDATAGLAEVSCWRWAWGAVAAAWAHFFKPTHQLAFEEFPVQGCFNKYQMNSTAWLLVNVWVQFCWAYI